MDAFLEWCDALFYVVGDRLVYWSHALRRRLRLLRYWRALRRPGATMTTVDRLGPPGSYFLVDSERVVVGRSTGTGPYATRVAPAKGRL